MTDFKKYLKARKEWKKANKEFRKVVKDLERKILENPDDTGIILDTDNTLSLVRSKEVAAYYTMKVELCKKRNSIFYKKTE